MNLALQTILYCAHNRPITHSADSFAYNDRSEVISATIDGNYETHEYDSIGNSTIVSFIDTTNTYSANNLNQYTSILCSSTFPREASYDLDGNLLTDGIHTFTYDAANRLKIVSTNGVQILTNFYDAKSRRVRKLTPETETTFFYDDWNLIEERVAYTNGTTSTIHYYWGKDLSGTLQGAGGVGGLLYLIANDTIYIPCYDNNGNITRYLDSSGNTVAQYTYDAFGNTILQSGPLAGFFRHRFSTKYFDAETGLYYYGYRFYHPFLMRWLNRDPLGERGDENQFLFVRNNPLLNIDAKGLDWRIKRDGDMFAYAIPSKANDTFEKLAQNLRLDFMDYKKWAHTSDASPHICKKYKIPNLVVYDRGGRKFVDRLPLNIINVWRGQNEKKAARDQKNGFMVLIRDNVSSKQIESILKMDGLYQYTFTGHGDGEAGINAYPDPFDAVSPAGRYTKYGISRMVLQACGSAALDGYSENNRKAGIVKRNNWELNVAKAGFFIGYEGAVTLLNELFQWTITKGVNHGTSD